MWNICLHVNLQQSFVFLFLAACLTNRRLPFQHTVFLPRFVFWCPTLSPTSLAVKVHHLNLGRVIPSPEEKWYSCLCNKDYVTWPCMTAILVQSYVDGDCNSLDGKGEIPWFRAVLPSAALPPQQLGCSHPSLKYNSYWGLSAVRVLGCMMGLHVLQAVST